MWKKINKSQQIIQHSEPKNIKPFENNNFSLLFKVTHKFSFGHPLMTVNVT